jgi:hypothetical protein
VPYRAGADRDRAGHPLSGCDADGPFMSVGARSTSLANGAAFQVETAPVCLLVPPVPSGPDPTRPVAHRVGLCVVLDPSRPCSGPPTPVLEPGSTPGIGTPRGWIPHSPTCPGPDLAQRKFSSPERDRRSRLARIFAPPRRMKTYAGTPSYPQPNLLLNRRIPIFGHPGNLVACLYNEGREGIAAGRAARPDLSSLAPGWPSGRK